MAQNTATDLENTAAYWIEQARADMAQKGRRSVYPLTLVPSVVTLLALIERADVLEWCGVGGTDLLAQRFDIGGGPWTIKVVGALAVLLSEAGIRHGIPATIRVGSDCYAAKIVHASTSNHRVTVEYVNSGGLDGEREVFNRNERGAYFTTRRARLTIGTARPYRDPSF